MIYTGNMLTIKDTQEILDISYPTALKLAQEVGQQVDGKWLLTEELVAARIAAEKRRVEKMEERLKLKSLIRIMQ